MRTALRALFASLLLTLLGGHALACYVVYDKNNNVIYDRFEPPVDMRYQLHRTMPARIPGGHLVFSTATTDCSGIDELPRYSPRGPVASTQRTVNRKRAVRRSGARYVKQVQYVRQVRYVKQVRYVPKVRYVRKR